MNLEKRGASMPFSWESFLAPRAPGREVVTPKSAEWLAERKRFKKEWKKMQKEGLEQGFLEYGLCYECAGTIEPTTHIEDHEYIYDEVS